MTAITVNRCDGSFSVGFPVRRVKVVVPELYVTNRGQRETPHGAARTVPAPSRTFHRVSRPS